MEKFYFTRDSGITSYNSLEDLHDKLDSGDWAIEPRLLNDGTLYRVTIEKVGVIRTTKEVEFDTARAEESN